MITLDKNNGQNNEIINATATLNFSPTPETKTFNIKSNNNLINKTFNINVKDCSRIYTSSHINQLVPPKIDLNDYYNDLEINDICGLFTASAQNFYQHDLLDFKLQTNTNGMFSFFNSIKNGVKNKLITENKTILFDFSYANILENPYVIGITIDHNIGMSIAKNPNDTLFNYQILNISTTTIYKQGTFEISQMKLYITIDISNKKYTFRFLLGNNEVDYSLNKDFENLIDFRIIDLLDLLKFESMFPIYIQDFNLGLI